MNLNLSAWKEMRQSMPICQRFAYFDHAAVAPLSQGAADAMRNWGQEAAELGDTVWPEWAARVERVRGQAAQLIGAAEQEIAFVPNTTAGISIVAEGLDWRPGDNVVTLANEFPSNIYPWQNLAARGVETRLVPVEAGMVDPQRIADACDNRTRLISVSWVGYATGWRIDVAAMARLAHERNALFFLDAIQGLGVFPLDVRSANVDFLAADGHKWLLGPEGAGIFFAKRELISQLRPSAAGWHSVQHCYDFSRIELDLRTDGGRFEGGSQNMVGIAALGESLELLNRFRHHPQSADPTTAIGNRVLEITNQLCEQLSRRGATILSNRELPNASGIVCFQIPGREPTMERRKCLDAGVVLSCRGGGLRASPHAYCNESDIDRLVQALFG